MAGDSDRSADSLERRLFELAPDPLVVTAQDGRILRANPAAAALVGRSVKELEGGRFQDLLYEADHAAVAAMQAEVVRTGAPSQSFRSRIVGPDGRWVWVESTTAFDPDTGTLFSVVRDVTNRDDSELERLAPLFDNAPLGMAVMALDGRLRRVNHTLERMLGRSREELRERTLFDLVDDADSRAALTVALGTRSRAAFQLETRLRAADGRGVIVLLSATLVTNVRQEPVHYICQILDITERAETQERLELNEAKLAEAQQIARLGSWEWEIATDRVTWSDELYRIYGVRPDRFSGSYGSNLDRVHPDDRARVARVIENAVAERRPWSLDYRVVRPDG